MLIANPIYDVVFKYLFEDNSVAKLFLSLILQKNIIKLDFRPTELKTKVEHNKSFLTVHRIDFSAKILNEDGSEELVVIEIQKAKFPSDIMRFRRYIGSQYMDESNQYDITSEIGIKKKALPIISIYFLGHKLDHTTVPVIHVKRNYYDLSSKNKDTIDIKEEFIESLTHDSYIIQIPYLKEKRQNDLLKVLSVFDQDNIQDNRHILNIKEDELPKEYGKIIRRLQKAMAKKEITDVMTVEDDILKDLEDKAREVQTSKEEVLKRDKIIKENQKVLEENQKVLEENQKVLEEKDKVLEEKDKVLEEKDKALIMAINILISQGMSEEEAKKKLGI